jgi:hypothetical protein
VLSDRIRIAAVHDRGASSRGTTRSKWEKHKRNYQEDTDHGNRRSPIRTPFVRGFARKVEGGTARRTVARITALGRLANRRFDRLYAGPSMPWAISHGLDRRADRTGKPIFIGGQNER